MLSLDKVEALTRLVQPPQVVPRNLDGPHQRFLGAFEPPVPGWVTAFDKAKLHTSFYSFPTLGRRVCVVYTHSHSSYLEEGLQLLEGCAKAQFSLCCYDSRGHGRSTKTPLTFGHKEHLDLLSVCLHLMLVHDIHEFVLWGRSIGSCAVLRLAHRLQTLHSQRILGVSDTKTSKKTKMEPLNLEKFFADFAEANGLPNSRPQLFRVLGLVLDSPVKSVQDLTKSFLSKLGWAFKPVTFLCSVFVEGFIKSRTGVDTTTNQNEALVGQINFPCVFLMSKNDELVTFGDCLELVGRYGREVGGRRNCHVVETNLRHTERRHGAVVREVCDQLSSDLLMNGSRFDHLFGAHLTSATTIHHDKDSNLDGSMTWSVTRASAPTHLKRPSSPLNVDLKRYNFSQATEGSRPSIHDPSLHQDSAISKGLPSKSSIQTFNLDIYATNPNPRAPTPIQDFSNRLRRSKEFVGPVFVSPGIVSPRQMSPARPDMGPKPSIFQPIGLPHPNRPPVPYYVTSQDNRNDHIRKMSFHGCEVVQMGPTGSGMTRSNSHIGLTETKRMTQPLQEPPASHFKPSLGSGTLTHTSLAPQLSHPQFHSHVPHSTQRSQTHLGLQQPTIARAISNTTINMNLISEIPALEPQGHLRERPHFSSFTNGRFQQTQPTEVCHPHTQLNSARSRGLESENHRSMIAPPATNKTAPLPTYALKESLANRIFKGAFRGGAPGDRPGYDSRRPIHR